MTEGEIAEVFIRAAETEQKLPSAMPRANPRGYVLPWVHTLGDINSRIRTGDRSEKLLGTDNPFHEWERAWIDEWDKRATPADISAWEQCLRWTAQFVPDAKERKALWAWAFSKAGGKPFARWCRSQGFHRNVGMDRKNRAVAKIFAQGFVRRAVQHSETVQNGALHICPENRDIEATFPEQRPDEKRPTAWRDPAFEPIWPADGEYNFDWAAKRNERRRQREAQKRKKVAA